MTIPSVWRVIMKIHKHTEPDLYINKYIFKKQTPKARGTQEQADQRILSPDLNVVNLNRP